MARPTTIDAVLVERARQAAAQATTLEQLRQAQSILLPADMGATLSQTAAALGVGRATAGRMQLRFRQSSQPQHRPPERTWGGRRNALLTHEEEKAFLQPWLEQAKTGGMLVVSPIRAALAEKLGQPIKPSVVYRLLARHGWRKVAPDTRHPKSDPAAQTDWKKNCPKSWRPCSSPRKSAADVCG